MPNILLEKSIEIIPERMKRWSQSKAKQNKKPVVDVTSDESKVQCCKEQYYIGIWNVRSMNQGTLDVVKQEMARLNTHILGVSEWKWTEVANLIQMTIISTTVGNNPLEEKEYHHSQKKSLKLYFDVILKMTEWSLFISKTNHSISG